MVVVSASFISFALLAASIQNAAAAPVTAAAAAPSSSTSPLAARRVSSASPSTGKKPMTVPLPAKVMAAKTSKSSKSSTAKKTNKPKSSAAASSSSGKSKHVEGEHHSATRGKKTSHASKHKSHGKHDKRWKNRLDSYDDEAPLLDVQATLFAAGDEGRELNTRLFPRHHDHDYDFDRHDSNGGHDHEHDHHHRRQLIDIDIGHPSHTVTYTQTTHQPAVRVAAAKSKLVSVKHGSHVHKVATVVAAAAAAASPTYVYYDRPNLLGLDLDIKRDVHHDDALIDVDVDLLLKRRGDHEHVHIHDSHHHHDDEHVHEHIHRGEHVHEHIHDSHRHHDDEHVHEHIHRGEHVHEHVHDSHRHHDDEHVHKHVHRATSGGKKDSVEYSPLFAAKSKGQPFKYVGAKQSKKTANHSKRADSPAPASCPDLATAVPGYLQLVQPTTEQSDAPVPLANLILQEEPSPEQTFTMDASNDTHAMVYMVREGAPDPATNGTIPAKFLVKMYNQSEGSMSCLCASFNPEDVSPLTLLPCDADGKSANVSQAFAFDPASSFVSPLWDEGSDNATAPTAPQKRAVPAPGTFFAQDGVAENVALPAPVTKTASAADEPDAMPSSTSTSSASPSSTVVPPAAAAAKQDVVLAFRPLVDNVKPVTKNATMTTKAAMSTATQSIESVSSTLDNTDPTPTPPVTGEDDSCDDDAPASDSAADDTAGESKGTPCEEGSTIKCSAPEEGSSTPTNAEETSSTPYEPEPTSTALPDKVIGKAVDHASGPLPVSQDS